MTRPCWPGPVRSWQPKPSAVPDTIADGLRHTSPARLPWEVNKVLLDDVVTVTDDGIIRAMRWASEYLKIVVEPSGSGPSWPGSRT
jgi:threonine dehydratase